MNVVDSSAWLEYFANGSNASFFAAPIEAIGTGCPLAATSSNNAKLRQPP